MIEKNLTAGQARVVKKELIEKRRQLNRAGRVNVMTALEIVPVDFPVCADLYVAIGGVTMMARALSDPDQRAEMYRLGVSVLEAYGTAAANCAVCSTAEPEQKAADEEIFPDIANASTIIECEVASPVSKTTAEAEMEADIKVEIEAGAGSVEKAEVVDVEIKGEDMDVSDADRLVSIPENEVPSNEGAPFAGEVESAGDDEVPDFLREPAPSERGSMGSDMARIYGTAEAFGRRRSF